MITKVSRRLAQQIVDTVKDVCGRDINFIAPSGTIFASTDKQRIGEFHEIGQRAAKIKTTIEVQSDGSFQGNAKGRKYSHFSSGNPSCSHRDQRAAGGGTQIRLSCPGGLQIS